MASARRGRRRGFTLPLTMVLAFALMTLASGVAGLVVVSDKAAKAAALDLVTRTTLESAIEASLFGLERDGEPEAARWTDRQSLNGLDVTISFQPVRYKTDIDKDGPDVVAAAISDPGLKAKVAAALAPPTPDAKAPAFERFIELVNAAKADAGEEDCLRQRLSLGRKGGLAEPAPPDNALIPTRDPLQVGELIDVRAELRDSVGRREALWRRVRYLGQPRRAWLTHDWRELRLPAVDMDCAAPTPALTPGPGYQGP